MFSVKFLLILESAATGSGETRETVVMRLVNDMLKNLPPKYDPFEIKKCYENMGHTKPMVIFLRQEIDRMQKV